jgi:hypothetical protein
MARRPLTFKQLDVTRALKAAIAAGVEVVRVEITQDGRIAMTVKKAEPVLAGQGGDEWGNI